MMFANTFLALLLTCCAALAGPSAPINNFSAHPPIHVQRFAATGPVGMTPSQVKAAYNLPATGGAGKTIAIVVAYDNPNVQADLNTFSAQYGLPQCNQANPCFTKKKMYNF